MFPDLSSIGLIDLINILVVTKDVVVDTFKYSMIATLALILFLCIIDFK